MDENRTPRRNSFDQNTFGQASYAAGYVAGLVGFVVVVARVALWMGWLGSNDGIRDLFTTVISSRFVQVAGCCALATALTLVAIAIARTDDE